ncbi:hypothetical protein [Floridanema evergladense]|uniref:Uncharacterized protein n=1 Tax=Floridaenema evergladense BLCC-F167 TaxID=3153639 RepID=A0ABV4WUM5_9CYAN
MKGYYQEFLIRDWQECDRNNAANILHSILTEYGLPWLPTAADNDVIQVEDVLKEAVKLYESSGYQPASGVETPRCDRIYVKYL